LDTYKLTDVSYDYEKYFLSLRNTTSQNYPYKPLLPIKAFMTEQDRMYSKDAKNFVTTGLKSLTSFLGTFEELITGVGYYLLKKTKEFSQDVAEAIVFFAKEQLEKIIPESIKTIFKRLKNCLVKIVNAIDNAGQLVKNKLGHDLAMANAFLCGLANGLISLVQTILMLLAFVVDKIPLLEVEKMTPSELVKHQEKLEFVEDTIDLLEEKVPHLVDAIKLLITDNKIWRELTSFCKLLKNKIANLNQYFWMFFIGAVTFEILLEVIIVIFTAGSGNVVSLSSKISRISTKAEQLATKTANFVGKLTSQVKNSLNQLIKWLKKEFEDLIEAVKSGKFVDYVKEKFYRLIDDQDGLRKIYLNKWLHKFDENFVNHLSGDVEFISQKVFNKKWLKYEEWIYLGTKGQGGHFMNKFVRIDEIIYPKNTYSMLQIAEDIPFKAKISVKSLNGKSFPKLAESSMFPKNWDVKRIQQEIAYVYENTVEKGIGLNPDSLSKKFKQYKFKDSSGKFDILIEIDEAENIMNAYPKL